MKDIASDDDSVESKAKTSDRNIHSSSKQKRGNRCLKLKTNLGFGQNKVLDLEQAVEDQEELEEKRALKEKMQFTEK